MKTGDKVRLSALGRDVLKDWCDMTKVRPNDIGRVVEVHENHVDVQWPRNEGYPSLWGGLALVNREDVEVIKPHHIDGSEIDYTDLDEEISRAIEKHGWIRTPLNPGMDAGRFLAILVEEVGEVATAQTYDRGSKEKERAECLQVAAMAYSRYVALGE